MEHWQKERNRVPTDDLHKTLQQPGNQHLAGDLDGIALEWLGQQWRDNPGAFSLPTRQHDLWQILKDGLRAAKERQGSAVSSESDLEKLAHDFLKETRAGAARDGANAPNDSFKKALDAYQRNLPQHTAGRPRDTSLLAAPQRSTFTPPREESGPSASDGPAESGMKDLAQEIAALFPLPETDVERMDLFGETADEPNSILKYSDA